MNVKSIEKSLPVLGFNGDFLISNNLDLSFGLKLQLPELLSCSQEKLYLLHDTFQRVVNLLPQDSLLHKQDFFFVEKFKAEESAAGSKASKLDESYGTHFTGREYLRHECFLYVSLLNKGLLKNYLSSSLIFSQKVRQADQYRSEKALELRSNLMALFSQSGISCDVISREQAVGTEESTGLIESYLTLNFQRENTVLGGIDFRDRLRVMDQFVEILSLSDYSHVPSLVKPVGGHPGTELPCSFVYPLTYHLPFSHITNQFIYMPGQQEVKANLESNYKKIYSLSRFSSENKINSGLIENFLDTVQTSGEKIVKTHFNVMVMDQSIKRLKQNKSECSSAFSLMNCFPYQHTFDLPLLFFSCLPFSTQLPETELFITQVPQACCLCNFEGEVSNSNSKFTLQFSNRQEGCPVKIDLSDEPMEKHLIHNRNKLIIGGSGSGKSFFTNHLLRQYAESGNCHVVLLDVGRSYEMLTRYLNESLKEQGGAMMVEFTTENPISFNPFVLEGELSVERKQTILSVIYTIYKEQLSDMEKDVIAHSVTDFLQTPGLERSFNGYYSFCRDYIPDLVEKQSLEFNSHEYFFILSKYFEGGEYDYLLNKPMKTDEFFNCPFLVFELDNIKDHPVIFPVATLIIMDIFLQKMRRLSGVRKVICIEEAWKAIATPQMAAYLKYFFKTIRKFFGEAMVVTQEVDDIISSPIIRDAIINNADTRILLDMSKFKNKFGQISQLLGLSDFQKEQILSINKNLPGDRKLKEVFIALGSYSRVFALEVSRAEYFCYTTEQKEKEMILTKLSGENSLIEILTNM
ncbi:TraG family conjugative transposon ATPase [Labilibaculum sp. A4]|uniref:TraG family conjugative transposon ATPase n=1 Tax=Labilibaculum euxinus TaxID=2686357 RepID=UPI000F627627|nr:TraG family conjugative transposon ATPase [Labilibaculum euxinus]MDQ1769314.1 TraG family conjugative transposon ATPase [Labilibaculum euxinus]MWN74839.1 TraG family conjugative transposon ATPase [Labilibaculum euxinus]